MIIHLSYVCEGTGDGGHGVWEQTRNVDNCIFYSVFLYERASPVVKVTSLIEGRENGEGGSFVKEAGR